MLYTVTYRNPRGVRKTLEIEAAGREALFAELKKRGIAAISVAEGRAKRGRGRSGTGILPVRNGRDARSTMRGILAGLIVVLGAGVALWHFAGSRSGENSSAEQQQAKPKTANTKARPGAESTTVAPVENGTIDAPIATKPMDDGLPPNKRIVEMISVVTNADGTVLERFRTADGKTRSRQTPPPPVFTNPSDQLLAMAISGAETGASMPPMPPISNADEEFIKSLDTEIVINDDDPEDVKKIKRQVIQLREEMKRLVEEGHSVAEVLREHRDLVNNSVEMRTEAKRLLKEFVDSGDRDTALEFLDKVNQTLAEQGIDGIEMPLSKEERREAIRERKNK